MTCKHPTPILRNLDNFSPGTFYSTPSLPLQLGTKKYIANNQFNKCCNDLNICKNNKMESTFMEIVNPKKTNIQVIFQKENN